MLGVEEGFCRRMACRNTASVLPVMLGTLSDICLKSALASVQTVFSFLFAMEFVSVLNLERENGLRLRYFMDEKGENLGNETYLIVVDALLRLLANGEVSKFIKGAILKILTESAQFDSSLYHRMCMALVSCEPPIKDIMKDFTSWPPCTIQLAQGKGVEISSLLYSENDESETCSIGSTYGFLEGPDTDARWRSKETASWLIAARNKDDDDDEEEEDDDDDAIEAGEEGEEEAEGEEGEEDDDDDDDEGGDGEEEGGDEEDGEEEDGDEDGEEEYEDEDEDDKEDDDDDDDNDEGSSQPPKKRKK